MIMIPICIFNGFFHKYKDQAIEGAKAPLVSYRKKEKISY